MRIPNLLNYKDTSYILIVLCYLSIQPVSILNNFILLLLVFIQCTNYFPFKYKKVLVNICLTKFFTIYT